MSGLLECNEVAPGAGDSWTSADMVDCILCFAATELVGKLTNPASQQVGRAKSHLLLHLGICFGGLTCCMKILSAPLALQGPSLIWSTKPITIAWHRTF